MTTSPVPGGRSTREVVELAPLDLLEELADDLVEHGAAHDHVACRRGEMRPTEMNLTPWARMGSMRFSPTTLGWRVMPSIMGDVGAVDVGVDETDAVAAAGEGHGEVDGYGGFSYAAFAGADGDDVVDAGERWWGLAGSAGVLPFICS